MAEEIISRAEAQARGLKRYFTGKCCKYGHLVERQASNGVCVSCRADIERRYNEANPEKLKAKRRAQATRHRLENPERIERNRRRWESANKDKLAQKNKRWRAANPERVKAQGKRLRERNPGKYREKIREWRERNRDRPDLKQKAIDRVNRWIKDNPERKREQARKGSHTRRARQYEAGGSYTNTEIRALLKQQQFICAEITCRADLGRGKELDHIIPISRGGGNHIDNLQWLCPPCNRQKRAMMPDEWAQYRAKLKEKKP